jgi:hypothetical protein
MWVWIMACDTNGRTRRLKVFESRMQKYFEDGGSVSVRNVGICHGAIIQKTDIEKCFYDCGGTVFVHAYGSGQQCVWL